MRRWSVLFLFIFVPFSFIFAQAPSQLPSPFLLPQTIYVGDPGRLVVPLGEDFAKAEPFIQDALDWSYNVSDLSIQRIELERRGEISRLLIDFIAYTPGLLPFPPIEILLDEETVFLELEVNITSVLNPARMGLAEMAPPLTQPGTGLLIFGSLGIILVVLFLGIGGSIWFRRHFSYFWKALRRRYLIRNMISFLRCLRLECGSNESETPGFYLNILSSELREFLSSFTGENCRPLSAVEFLDMPLWNLQESPGAENQNNSVPHINVSLQSDISGIFKNLDTLRFSGREFQISHVFEAIDEAGIFITAMNRIEREIPLFRPKDIIPEETSTFNKRRFNERQFNERQFNVMPGETS